MVALALVAGLGTLTYYYFAFLPLAATAVLLLRTRTLGLARLLLLTGAHGAGVFLFLPWGLLLLRQVRAGMTLAVPTEMQTHLAPEQYLLEVARVFSSGYVAQRELAAALALGLAVPAAIALLGRGRGLASRLLLLALAALPLLFAYVVTQNRPFFYPRFLIFTLPVVLVLAGAGLAQVAQRSRALAATWGLAFALGSVVALEAHISGGRYAFAGRDVFMQIDALREYGRPGDAVVSGYAWQEGYLAAYLPTAGFRLRYNPSPTTEEVADLLAQSGRVWVLSHSPEKRWTGLRGEEAAARVGVSAYTRQQGDARIRLFRSPDAPPPPSDRAAIAAVGKDFRLRATRVPSIDALRPGAELAVELEWQALQRPERELTVFVQLLGPSSDPGVPGPRVVAQQDNPPLNGTRPTTTFSTGEILVDPYRLRLPAALAPGTYILQTGLYHAPSGAREPVAGRSAEEGDRVILARYVVE